MNDSDQNQVQCFYSFVSRSACCGIYIDVKSQKCIKSWEKLFFNQTRSNLSPVAKREFLPYAAEVQF